MNKKHEAQQLYMNGCRTQKEIADIIGVSERTVHTWIHQYAWDKLRLAAYQAPATIADNLCAQIVELQNAIARKAPGTRYPTQQEAEIMRKLIVCLEKVKKTPSLSQNMQMLETFRNYVRPLDKEFTKKLSSYTNKFLSAKSANGYAPYQAEYGVDPVPPLSHIYDEVPDPSAEMQEENSGALGSPHYKACPDINTCLHQGDCTYPKCLHPERYVPPVDPATLYRITPVLNAMFSDLQEGPAIVSLPDYDAVIRNEAQVIPGSVDEHQNEIVGFPFIDRSHSEGGEVSGVGCFSNDKPATTSNFPATQENETTPATDPYFLSYDPRDPDSDNFVNGRSNPATLQYKTTENNKVNYPQNEPAVSARSLGEGPAAIGTMQ